MSNVKSNSNKPANKKNNNNNDNDNNNNNNNDDNNNGLFGNLGFGNNNNEKKNTGNKNTGTNTNAKSTGNDVATAKEEAGVYEVMTENYFLLLGIVSALVILMLVYFLSESFRVDRTLSKMQIYQGFQRLQSVKYDQFGNNRIGDYHIASAYNAAHCGYQMYDYTSEKVVLGALKSGARYLEFNVFNSEFGDKAFPVVSMGYKKGEWKMTLSDTPLEKIFNVIKQNAFKVNEGNEGVSNPEDPIIIGLKLNTNSNLDCLNLIAYLITQYFGDRLLPNQYSFQNNDDIADMKMSMAMEKVIIFASDGFQGSGLEELVNYSWDNVNKNPKHNMRRLHYSKLLKPDFDARELIEFNKKGLTIIIPHEEGDFFNTNFDTTKAFELGCQFIAMEYQYIDGYMDSYITRFKNNSLILKDETLRKGGVSKNKTTTTTIPSGGSKTNESPTISTTTTKSATTSTTKSATTSTTKKG